MNSLKLFSLIELLELTLRTILNPLNQTLGTGIKDIQTLEKNSIDTFNRRNLVFPQYQGQEWVKMKQEHRVVEHHAKPLWSRLKG